MSSSKEFAEYVVHDVLGELEHVTARKMFGGYGIYKDKKIFAIIVDDELYLKGKGDTEQFFVRKGSKPFTYSKRDGKTYTMHYYHVPGEVLEDREVLNEWLTATHLTEHIRA